MDQPKYRIEIFWSDEDGGYIANVPDLRYCSAFGESYEEALREVLVAMELHLDTLRELGRPIPEPGSRRGVGVSAIVLDSGQAVELTEEAGGVSAQIVDEIGEGVGSAIGDVSEGVGQELDAPEGGMRLSRRFFDNWDGTVEEHSRGSVEEGQPNATEAAKRKAEELGVDLSRIEGTGSGGLITIKDVVQAAHR
jgi:predicted RNase H-like HicB family nuclease